MVSHGYKFQCQDQNPGSSEPKCRCSPPRQPAWAPAARHAAAVRNTAREKSKILPQGGHSFTETQKSPWEPGKDKPGGQTGLDSPEAEGRAPSERKM